MLYSNNNGKQSEKYTPVIDNNFEKVTASTLSKVLWIILVVLTLGLLLIKVITTKNYFKNLEMKINESASNIDIQLEKRYDTLTKLLASVKGHINLDKEIFTKIAAYRSGMTLDEKTQILNKVNSALAVQFENYPNLDASESIRTFNTELIMIEREIAASRRLYNSLVTRFNAEIYQWPNNVILANSDYQGIPLYVTDIEKRSDINVNF
ncbi:MAG: LemA family protein [Ureaplasma sp.]|nr:LemA family protein [Ureaplasma sp.]